MSGKRPSPTPYSGQGSYEPTVTKEDGAQLDLLDQAQAATKDTLTLVHQEPKSPSSGEEPCGSHTSPRTSANSPDSLPGQIKDLSISSDSPELHTHPDDMSLRASEKEEICVSSAPAGTPKSPVNTLSGWAEKELLDVSDGKDSSKNPDMPDNRESDSQPEIQSIMTQFKDSERNGCGQGVMSPRLELAEQLLSGQSCFPPRNSSLGYNKPEEPGSVKSITSSMSPTMRPASIKSLARSVANEDAATRRSSISTILPVPEPEPERPFDFHRFLEQLRHRTADPVAKFLRSFLMEFGKKQWMVHEQVKIISDFLVFITNKMAQCDVWREVSDGEFDNAKEGMEKLVMNRLYLQTFSPAIPQPPIIPRNAGRSRRRELERLHGPWRRGQHQEDVERDEVLTQKMGIYSWVREKHLDIQPVGQHGRKFLNLAKEELLKINGYRAPRDKVICILNCCKVIFGLLKNTKKEDTSADSFMPLLIYVVLQARPENLVSNIQYILRFRNQDKLGGEAGYYLSSLSGATQFIETLDRTSLTVSDEEFERNVEATVSSIAEQNRKCETLEQKRTGQQKGIQGGQWGSSDRQRQADLKDGSQSTEDDIAPVTGLLRTIQKPLSTIGRMFTDDVDSDRPVQLATTPQPEVPPRLTVDAYKPPRSSNEERRPQQPTPVLDTQDAAVQQASAEDAEARRIQRAAHSDVVDTLSNMFPNLDRDVIDDVVKLKEGRVGLAVDACLALSTE